jgi:tetratricopeptide (TPR) repeat protein
MRPLTALSLTAVVLSGCASGGGAVRINPPAGTTPPPSSIQALYEAGRDDEVVSRVASPAVRSEEVWFGAQSRLRSGQRAEASDEFRRLRDSAESDAFRRAAEVALARVDGQPGALQVAQAAAALFPDDPFVQFEAGVTMAVQGEVAASARAFDAAISASPMLAYAYYQAGLLYSRIDRPDLTVARFETFVRLAPSAPERAQVESILRTARGR